MMILGQYRKTGSPPLSKVYSTFGNLSRVGLLILSLLVSGCFEESQDESNATKLTKSELDTEIKRTNHTGPYHHVEGCSTCHDVTGNSSNVALIRHVIDTPNSGPKPVVFTSRTGSNSFADGDETYDGPCEVCHTINAHHNNDGYDNTAHNDGKVCTTCHIHDQQFAAPTMPYVQSHQTHLNSKHVTGMGIVCTTCHNDPSVDPLVFADMKPLSSTTVCNSCHSPGGTYPGTGGLMNPTLGAKANYKTGGIYEADGITLRAGKEKWCASCHDESPSVINGATAPTTMVGVSVQYHNVDGCQTCHDVSGNATNLSLIKSTIATPNSGAKPVIFTALTGANSFADGDATFNGVCEVCHTTAGHHQNNGADVTAHNDGATCTSCHTHDQQFTAPALPYIQSHETHLQSKHVTGMNIVCTTCHNDPGVDPLIFADMQPLATTTVCDSCHSPDGTYPGANGLLNASLGAKANYKTGGIYEADGVTLKAGKDKWCASCHDESPSVINGATAPTTMVGVSAQYHYVNGCQTCHDISGNSTNLAFINETINTPNSGLKNVVFTALTGTNSFADGDATYNGPCEVCHTLTGHHQNNGADATTHNDGATCTTCHLHGEQFAAPVLPYTESHNTHIQSALTKGHSLACTDCHSAGDYLVFADMQPLATTTVCDSCHSPGGTYPGVDGLLNAVLGAKANYKTGGVYKANGLELKPGKEKWCATCHDEQQSISRPSGLASSAPNIVGDNSTYGYWATGHGKSIDNCLECHDARKKHIDHEHRTYEVDEVTKAAINNWGDSYRLRTSNAKANELLCTKCHDRDALENVGEQSNSKNLQSGHYYHIWSPTAQVIIKSDSDYDGLADSKIGCTSCHNVHGSKSPAMIRSGELASTPGTTDRTPSLNLTYVKKAAGPFSTATWRPMLPGAGTFGVYVWWKLTTFLETEAKYTIYHDGGSSIVTLSQAGDGDRWVPLGSYPFLAGTTGYIELSAENTIGDNPLLADKIGIDTNGDTIPDIIIDDADPEFSSIDVMNGGAIWPWSDLAVARALTNEERFELDVPFAESTSGYLRFNVRGGAGSNIAYNKVCANCHGRYAYPRTPFMGPKVINRFEERRWVLNDGTGVADIVVSVTDPDGDMAGGSVNIDVSSLGGGASVAMTNNGDGTYSYQVAVALDTFDKAYKLPITATDMAGNVGTGTSSVFVKSSVDSIYLDNIDAVHTSADNWKRALASANAYNSDSIWAVNYTQYAEAESALTATWTTTIKKTGS